MTDHDESGAAANGGGPVAAESAPSTNPMEWTDEQLEQFKAEWERQTAREQRTLERSGVRLYRERYKLLKPLPRRVRLRLAVGRALRMWRS